MRKSLKTLAGVLLSAALASGVVTSPAHAQEDASAPPAIAEEHSTDSQVQASPVASPIPGLAFPISGLAALTPEILGAIVASVAVVAAIGVAAIVSSQQNKSTAPAGTTPGGNKGTSNPNPAKSNKQSGKTGVNNFSGTVRLLTGSEVAKRQGTTPPNNEGPSHLYIVLIPDASVDWFTARSISDGHGCDVFKPTIRPEGICTKRLDSYGYKGKFIRLAAISPSSSSKEKQFFNSLRPLVGKTVTFKANGDKCGWPTDTMLPLGAPFCAEFQTNGVTHKP